MSKIKISCTVSTNDPGAPLGIEVWLDNTQLFNDDKFTYKSLPLEWETEEVDGDHELRFVLKNKNITHTTIDKDGNITKDSVIIIDHLAFDDIELSQIVTNNATYTHDFNGSKELTCEKFYGTMGCNGVVSLKFSVPMYLWLLENM